MTTEIEDLLAEAADDSAQPIYHSIDDVVRRGRRGVRLRRASMVAASVVTAGAVIIGVTTWAGGNKTGGVQPAGTPETTVTIDAKTGELLPLQPPASKLTDAQIINRCKVLDNQWQQGSHKAGGGTGSITGWKVAVNQAEGSWLRAILVSPDHKRWAVCQDNQGSGAPYDRYLREDLNLQKDFAVWTDRDGAEGVVPKNVARVTFQIGDQPVPAAARVSNGFLLWYADLGYLDVRDKPIWAVFYDATGREVARFDSNVYNPAEGYNADRKPIFPK
ncbi:MAG: hypothetical protein QOH50_2294 [Kribbellaceae bacterium]|nr:hypothetical protein [Kribbellaceae bacterium]